MNNPNKQLEDDFKRALRLSEESFKKEQQLRQQAIQLQIQQEKIKKQQLIQQQQLQKQKKLQLQQQQQLIKSNQQDRYKTMINLLKWQNIFIQRGVGSGIQNLGNSCFMNATLQCLAYTPSFSQLLCQSNHSSKCKSNKFCALCEMETVIPSMLMSKKIISPRNLFRNLPRINDLLTAGCQEDAHEFIQSILDKIEIAYDDAQKPLKKRDPQNPIRKLFTGATKTSILCARCETKSVTEEPFCCISLEVDDNVGLREALASFTDGETMKGVDKYFCNVCNRKCIARKRLQLSSIPPILVLHFKRFCVQFAASHHKQGTTKKLHDHVEFPEILDFKTVKQDILYDDDRNQINIDSKYELYAVLVHSGPQLGYGHYYALIKAPNDKWYRMNDMDVNRVNIKRVLKEQGYIVFYKRKTSNNMVNELNKIKLANNNNSSSNDIDLKVDPSLVTDDYFANNCPDQDAVFVNNNNLIIGNNDPSQDRTQYVQVPPMATVPDNINNNDNNNNNANVYQHVFWPPTNIDKPN